MTKFNTAYSERNRVSLDCGTVSKTQQSFKKECDINNIMQKYNKTGLVTHVNNYNGDYSDVSNVPTYHEALGIIEGAHTAFNTLPSEIRKMFDNDPGRFLDFVHNSDNVEAMREMGLMKPSDAVVDLDPQPEPKQPEPEA
jgi:phage internal scaffolding protein